MHKLDAYDGVLQKLVLEMEQCSPERWERGELKIESQGEAGASPRLTYTLRNEGHPDRADLTEDLRMRIDEVFVAMRQGGDAWRAARIRWWIEGGAIRFDPSFEFTGEPAPKRNWWRR